MSEHDDDEEFGRWMREAHLAALEEITARLDVRRGLRALKLRAARRPRIRRWRRRWH